MINILGGYFRVILKDQTSQGLLSFQKMCRDNNITFTFISEYCLGVRVPPFKTHLLYGFCSSIYRYKSAKFFR